MLQRKMAQRLAVLLLMFLTWAAGSYAEKKTSEVVRVGWYDSPFCRIDSLGERSGYTYDYLRRIASNTGWRYEYIEGDWPDLLEMLKEGKIDVLDNVSFKPERTQQMLFSERMMGQEDFFIVALIEHPQIEVGDIPSLNGKRVGVASGTYEEKLVREWAKHKNLNIEVVPIKLTGVEYMYYLEKGNVDAMVVSTSLYDFLGSNVVSVTNIGSAPYYFAINKNRPDLKVQLDYAMEHIHIHNGSYNEQLHKKYLKKSDITRYLPLRERNWLEQHGKIRVAYRDNYMPFCAQDKETGQPIGLLHDFLEQARESLSNADVDFVATAYPTINAAMKAVVKGEADVAFPNALTYYDAEAEHLLITDHLLVSAEMAVMRNGDYFQPTKKLKVAINAKNPNYISLIQNNYPHWEMVHFDSTIEALKGVAEGEADLLLLSNYRISIMSDKIEELGLKSIATGLESKHAFTVKEGNCELYSIMNHLAKIPSQGAIQASLADYSEATKGISVKRFVKNNMVPVALSIALIIAVILWLLRRAVKANRKTQEHLQEIYELNHNLQENQAQLEELTAEQESQIEEIQRLNEMFNETQDHGIRNLLNNIIKRKHDEKMIDHLLQIVGEYYNADRAYVFEQDKTGQYTVNTYEWCADGITPEKDNLQEVPIHVVDPWMAEFRRKGSFYIHCDDEYAKKEPFVYEVLEPQGITSLMAAPMIVEGEIIGFLGVDNPKENTAHEIYISVAATAVNHERQIQIEKENEREYKKDLELAREVAEAANAAKTSFLFNMSHDIRTPMNAIIGFTDLLRKHQDSPEKREDYLTKITGASSVLLSIINNVLEMARIEKGTIEIDETAWSAEQFNDTIFSIFHEMMKNKNLEFTREINVEHKYVMCDPTKLREVFINILSNAYKYTNAGGKVHMKLEEIPSDKKEYALYRTTITDTGIGMSEEYLPHLFEEFSRENNTTENKIEGTGLGMPIVKRLVELMHGNIEVTSKLGEGTTFVVTIPHKITDRSRLVEHAGVELDPKLFVGKRILLAEDNDLNAEIAMEILSEVGFIVERAEDGTRCVEMLEKAEDNYYSLILMDIQMPNMNGYETTRTIRAMANKTKMSIPILAMTANAFEEDKREAVNSGMNGHLAKPINVTELMKALAEQV